MKSSGYSKRLRELLVTLSKDPKVKNALSTLKAKSNGSNKVNSFKELFIHLLRLSSKFLGKKKARFLEEWIDAAELLISLSLVLKENIFDRPEVRAFFEESWDGLKKQSMHFYLAATKFVAETLRKMKRRSN